MSTGAITPYRSGQRPGRDGFAQLLRAEWTKFRTVRGWVLATVAAALLTALAIVALAGTARDNNSRPAVATGPGGEAVTDDFEFVHQPLTGNGSITVRVTSLAGTEAQPGPTGIQTEHVSQPWAKAGIIITAGTKPGSAYAAVMATPGHGVRMQYDYTHDTAGLPGRVAAPSPRWLRLTRSGTTVTSFDSADGSHWTEIGTARLAGLPATVQAGLFVASPPDYQMRQTFANNNGAITSTDATAVFDHVSRQGDWPGRTWSSQQVGGNENTGSRPPVHAYCQPGSCQKLPAVAEGAHEHGGTFTVAGSGDIAPYIPIVDPIGVTLKASLIGLLAAIALGALFITAEFRRGLIRTTFAASPRRGRVLAAKAIVIGSVTFAAGLVGTAVAFPLAEHKLRSGGWPVSMYPIRSLISGPAVQMVVGTAALIAVAAILALAAGAALRRSAGAITAAVVLLVLPLILATVLPQAPAQWLLRLTPAAAFGVQQGNPHYAQVNFACLPYNGCYPLAPWAGFAVLCAWVALALGGAVLLLRRRDV
jgi:hypothetical protein